MNKDIKILDCTLRDGGYVNDWLWGTKEAKDIINLSGTTGVDYIELGFIDNFQTIKDGQIQFTNMHQVRDLFDRKKCKIAIMVNIGYGYPVENFPEHSKDTADLIRVVLWDRMIESGVDYSKALKDKGYEVCIQATHTPQYNDERFLQFVRLYNEVKPLAFYIVDTFGELTKKELFRYAQMVDDNLDEGIRIGYHAHNNMQQAYANALYFMENSWKHDIMLDASVYGIGRGAGNLCLELLLTYMNEEQNGKYSIAPLYDIYEKYIKGYYSQMPWGYSLPYFLSAKNGINPNFALSTMERGLDISDVRAIFAELKRRDLTERFDENIISSLIDELGIRKQ